MFLSLQRAVYPLARGSMAQGGPLAGTQQVYTKMARQQHETVSAARELFVAPPLALDDPRAKSEKKHSCPRCGRTYTSSSSLSRHMQIHTGKFSFYCEECKKGFNEKTNYDQHIAKHEGRTFYFPCPKCGRRFLSAQRLAEHKTEWGQCV